MKRDLRIYIPLILILFPIGFSTRVDAFALPSWVINYAGDFLWSMLVFLLFSVVFRLTTLQGWILSIITTFFIEWTQLFHPPWLETLRSFRIIGLVIGYSFIWTDLIAYASGISLAALVDRAIMTRTKGPKSDRSGS